MAAGTRCSSHPQPRVRPETAPHSGRLRARPGMRTGGGGAARTGLEAVAFGRRGGWTQAGEADPPARSAAGVGAPSRVPSVPPVTPRRSPHICWPLRTAGGGSDPLTTKSLHAPNPEECPANSLYKRSDVLLTKAARVCGFQSPGTRAVTAPHPRLPRPGSRPHLPAPRQRWEPCCFHTARSGN